MDKELREKAEYVAERLLGWTGEPPEACYLDLEDSPRSLDELNSWTGAGEIIEAMRERGFHFMSMWGHSPYKSMATFWMDADNESGVGDTLPEAILNAAYEALKGEG